MFHMMNEARIAVGLGATMLGYAGYEASLDYARNGRPQAARWGGQGSGAAADPHHPPRRRAHAAGAEELVEGAGAGAVLRAPGRRAAHRRADEAARRQGLLLEMLTPIAKSWPSEWCLRRTALAIQVHGGYGYTRDFPVEQYWRDNRLNMIHEGTHGIQALDLLGRKVVMDGGAGLMAAGWHGQRDDPARAGACRAGASPTLAAALAEVGPPPRPPGPPAWPRRRWPMPCLPAGLRPHGDRLDLARRGAVRAREAGAGR